MSEKYFNAYVDSAVGMIHEYVTSTLQLKAQMRVANEVIAEKDKLLSDKDTLIADLQNNLVVLGNHSSENEKLRTDAKYWEDSYHGMLNKVSHMETLTNQYNDLKKQYLSQSEELEKLRNQLQEKCSEIEGIKNKTVEIENATKSTKKTINTKSNATQNSADSKTKEVTTDDF